MRVRDLFRAGKLAPLEEAPADAETAVRLPEAFQSTVGTLLVVGIAVLGEVPGWQHAVALTCALAGVLVVSRTRS